MSAAETREARDLEKGHTIGQTIRELADRRLLFVFLFGIGSGFPWVIHTSAMTARLADAGLARSMIGLFGLVTTAYAINFLWAPFIDRLIVPVLGRLGPRRGWMLTAILVMGGSAAALAIIDPTPRLALEGPWGEDTVTVEMWRGSGMETVEVGPPSEGGAPETPFTEAATLVVRSEGTTYPPVNVEPGERVTWVDLTEWGAEGSGWLISSVPNRALALLALAAVVLAFASATYDVANDAYRIEIIPKVETAKISHASALTVCGWWTGFGIMGSIPFFLADRPAWTWNRVFWVLAAFWGLLALIVFLAPRAPQQRDKFAEAEERYREALGDREHPGLWKRFAAWMAVTLVEPLVEFVKRVGPKLAYSVIAFVFLFKLGEAFLGRMSIVFYKEVGFSDAQIGFYSKLFGGSLTIVFSLVGGAVNAKFGLIKGLLFGGIAMAASNLMYSWMAWMGPVEWLYGMTVLVDGITSAFATVAFVAFVSYLVSHTYTATQYALLASLANFGRTTVSAASGFVVDALGGDWSLFFILTALMVIPSLLLLIYVRRQLYKRQEYWAEDSSTSATGEKLE